MAIIISDIDLLIFEQADTKTLQSLALTCHRSYSLLKTYEISIVKSKILRTIANPILRPPLGSVLSSHGPERKILKPWSYEVVRELELRATRIDKLFETSQSNRTTSLVQALMRIDIFRSLPQHQIPHVLALLKHACMLADRIADAAIVVRLPESTRFPPSDPYAIKHRVHRTQQEFIRNLPPHDVALILHLCALAGIAYADAHPALDTDPEGIERIVAFKETVLRQGSMALWGFLSQSHTGAVALSSISASLPPAHTEDEVGRFVAKKVDLALQEIRQYEDGLREDSDSDLESGEVEGDGGHDPFLVLAGLHQTAMKTIAQTILDKSDEKGDNKEGDDGDNHGDASDGKEQSPQDKLVFELIQKLSRT
ncbi:hypothetical protein QBC35DRAFT_429872 [Podospora australis]|uniref:Uncharacterized protein n=1 Tax=Podospora australis TaxID=1536484 RepID=A0AAN7AK67_9PEZI|nr:hypothetical protein QBC35DRAFT_429872 [Podospora australis]